MVLAGIGAGLAVIGAGFGIGKIGGAAMDVAKLYAIGQGRTPTSGTGSTGTSLYNQ